MKRSIAYASRYRPSPYSRSTAAARSIQRAFRSSRSRSMSVVSVPRSRFRNIDTKIFRTRRTICQNITFALYGPGAGWNTGVSAYPDLSITHALTATTMWINGFIVYQPVMPAFAEFTALFDHYRIDRVNITAFFSANRVSVGETPFVEQHSLPMLHIMNDYNSPTIVQTLSDYMQKPDCRHIQLGTGKTVRHSYVPRIRENAVLDSETGTATGVSKSGQWIDTNSSSISHTGCRLYLDNFGRFGVDDQVGTVQLLIEHEMSFKSVK